MSLRFKILILFLLTTALACGFMHHIIQPEVLNFERLHIFLFNLCVGGTLLIYFTERKRDLSIHGKLYCLGSLLFALTAFMEYYPPTLFLPLALAVITERVRVLHLGHCIPLEMLSGKEPVAKKFHQASLLCLSLALIISSFVILNAVYLHLFTIPKLTLDTFFLGFSFPLSLISMSVIFSLMQRAKTSFARTLKEISFWVINLGVILFFLFILAGLFIPQVIVASTLFLAVGLVFFLYIFLGIPSQQKEFLLSGILFLLCTSITGIIYIFLEFAPLYNPEDSLPLLRMHAFMALYGWNLSGLAVATRHGEFPLQLHTKPTIALHWITVVILCPLGYFFAPVAIAAVLAYAIFLYQLLFGTGTGETYKKLTIATKKSPTLDQEN